MTLISISDENFHIWTFNLLSDLQGIKYTLLQLFLLYFCYSNCRFAYFLLHKLFFALFCCYAIYGGFSTGLSLFNAPGYEATFIHH